MWFRKSEPIDFQASCVCCGCSIDKSVHFLHRSKEILLAWDFSSYVGEFVDYKFHNNTITDVVLKWVPTDGVKLYSSVDSDYNSTSRLLSFLELKFNKACECNEKE